MVRKLKNFYNTNPNDYMSYLLSKGYRVYPVNVGEDSWKIEWQEDDHKPRRGNKTYVGDLKINNAMYEAVKYLAETLKAKEQ